MAHASRRPTTTGVKVTYEIIYIVRGRDHEARITTIVDLDVAGSR
jgi:hypothetical protein